MPAAGTLDASVAEILEVKLALIGAVESQAPLGASILAELQARLLRLGPALSRQLVRKLPMAPAFCVGDFMVDASDCTKTACNERDEASSSLPADRRAPPVGVCRRAQPLPPHSNLNAITELRKNVGT